MDLQISSPSEIFYRILCSFTDRVHENCNKVFSAETPNNAYFNTENGKEEKILIYQLNRLDILINTFPILRKYIKYFGCTM